MFFLIFVIGIDVTVRESSPVHDELPVVFEYFYLTEVTPYRLDRYKAIGVEIRREVER